MYFWGVSRLTDLPRPIAASSLFFALVMAIGLAGIVGGLLQLLLGNPMASLQATVVSMTATQVVGFGLAAVLVAWYSRKPGVILPLRRPDIRQMALATVVLAVSIPLVSWTMLSPEDLALPGGLQKLQDELVAIEKEVEATLSPLLAGPLVLSLFVVAVVPALCEEAFFRGAVLQNLRHLLPLHLAVVVVGLVFSLIHFQVYGFFGRWLLGMLLAYLAVWGRSLWPAVWTHFLNNALGVLGLKYAQNGAAGLDTFEVPVWVAVSSLGVTVAGLYAYRRLQPPLAPSLPHLDRGT